MSNEQLTKDQVITIVPCQTKQDCIRNIRFMKCGPSVVFCYEGYCACKHLNKESGIKVEINEKKLSTKVK